MSNLYPDLENNFPASVDNFDKLVDPDSASISIINQYYAYFDVGNIVGATAILDANPQLKSMILNAENMNKYRDAIISVQRYYLNDVQQYLVNIVKPKGEWNISAKYTKYDVVQYVKGGAIESYMGIKTEIPLGTPPTNIDYFIAITLRGEQGSSGLGLSPRGYWNSMIQYYKDDCISYNNILWYAKHDNVSKIPQDNSGDWEKLILFSKQIISSVTMPGNQVTGDMWFEEDSGNAFNIKEKNNDGTYTQLFPKTKANLVTETDDKNFISTSKKSEIDLHLANTNAHVTQAEKTSWSGKQNALPNIMQSNVAQTMTSQLTAGGVQTEAIRQVRNSVVMPTGTTDFSSVLNSTLIFVKK